MVESQNKILVLNWMAYRQGFIVEKKRKFSPMNELTCCFMKQNSSITTVKNTKSGLNNCIDLEQL